MQKLTKLLLAFSAIAALTISLPARTQTADAKPANVAGECSGYDFMTAAIQLQPA